MGTKIAEENQQMIAQIVKLLANKDDKETGTQMVKAVTDILAQHGIAGSKNGKFLISLRNL